MALQVPVVGIPFPVLVNETNNIQVPVYDTLVAANQPSVTLSGVSGTGSAGTLSTEIDVTATGQVATSAIGTPTLVYGSAVALTGLSATAAIGTPTVEIDTSVTVTGVAATTGIGTPIPEIDFTLDGLEATTEIGTPVPEIDIQPDGVVATAAIGTPTLEIDTNVTLTGLEATTAIGTPSPEITLFVFLTGLEATADVGTPVPKIDIHPAGLGATAAIGTPVVTTDRNAVVIGQQALAFIGIPLAIVTPNFTNVTPTGQQVTASIGLPVQRATVTLTGQAATSHIGVPQPVTFQGGLQLGDLECAEPKNADDIFVGLRWSDTYGESWNYPLHQSKGSEGQYLTNLQFRRLGLSRNRVFEVSWSSPTPTALQGVTIQYEIAAT